MDTRNLGALGVELEEMGPRESESACSNDTVLTGVAGASCHPLVADGAVRTVACEGVCGVVPVFAGVADMGWRERDGYRVRVKFLAERNDRRRDLVRSLVFGREVGRVSTSRGR